MVSVEEKMSELASVCYSLDVLRKRPLPPDVDPLRIEDYVKDEDFEVTHHSVLCMLETLIIACIYPN